MSTDSDYAMENIFDYQAYCGIGSRETPRRILGMMSVLAYHLARQGWILRSGGAPGADTAFEAGHLAAMDEEAVVRPEIYLPWEGFEDRDRVFGGLKEPTQRALEVASTYHPKWDDISQGAQKLHGRNAHQVLGQNVDSPALPVFIICWTRDGKGAGGTGQALRIARGYGVQEIYDLCKPDDYAKMKAWLSDR